MSTMASQITSLTIVYSTVYSGANQRKHQRSVSLAFVRWIHRWPVNSPHKWPVTRKIFPFDDVIMIFRNASWFNYHAPVGQPRGILFPGNKVGPIRKGSVILDLHGNCINACLLHLLTVLGRTAGAQLKWKCAIKPHEHLSVKLSFTRCM